MNLPPLGACRSFAQVEAWRELLAKNAPNLEILDLGLEPGARNLDLAAEVLGDLAAARSRRGQLPALRKVIFRSIPGEEERWALRGFGRATDLDSMLQRTDLPEGVTLSFLAERLG